MDVVQLLAMVPAPSKAILLVFPITEATEKKRHEDDERLAKEGQPDIDPTLIYIKQTVRVFALSFRVLCSDYGKDLECLWNDWTVTRDCECEPFQTTRRNHGSDLTVL